MLLTELRYYKKYVELCFWIATSQVGMGKSTHFYLDE